MIKNTVGISLNLWRPSIISLLLFFAPIVYSQSFTKITNDPSVTSITQSYGASFIDFDNDGDLDLYIANFTNTTNELFLNNGNGTFTTSNLNTLTTTLGSSLGHTWLDFDKDCDLDLFISNGGVNGSQTNKLYINNNGIYTIVGSTIIPTTTSNSQTSNWGDYDNDGDLDLFIANLSSQNNLFLINNNGIFTSSNTSVIATDGGISNDANWVDYDNDGDLDLFVANAGNQNNFLYNNNNGIFTKVTIGSIVTDSKLSIGSVWGDYNNDGYLDLYVCNTGTNSLYSNNGNGTFTKILTGTIVTDNYNSYGATWVDYNNDGYLDLFVTNTLNQNNNLYKNNSNGTFTKITTGSIVTDGGQSRSNTWADIDADGDLDCYVTNRSYSPNYLYLNNSSSLNHWINIKLIGTISNYDAIGCIVKAKATFNGNSVWQMRHISAKAGYCSQESPNVEFGFGNATQIDSLIMFWPSSNSTCVFTNIQTNQFLTYYENCTSINQMHLSDTICLGGDYVININGYIYDWFSDSLGTNYVITDSIFQFTNLQNDTTIFFSSNNSCGNTLNSFSISVSGNSFTINIGSDTTICTDDSLIINLAYSSNQVLWQDGSSDTSYVISSSGQYYVDIDNVGCLGTDTINVVVQPRPVQHTLIDTMFCNSIVYNFIPDTGFSYTWSDGSNLSQMTIDSTGLYWVQVYNLCDTIIDTVKVIVDKFPKQQPLKNIELCIGDQYNYSPETGFYYLWSDGSNLGNRVFSDSGDYWIQVSNQCDTVKNLINVDMIDCDCHIFIPNVFTPNGDGLNDNFFAVISCELDYYEMLIFNRWGKLLFHSTNQNEKWNGEYQNNEAPDAVYFFRMNYIHKRTSPNTDNKTGTVTILR